MQGLIDKDSNILAYIGSKMRITSPCFNHTYSQHKYHLYVFSHSQYPKMLLEKMHKLETSL